MADLGPALAVPAGVPVFDLGNRVLTPGLVAAFSHLGLVGSALDDPAEANAGQVRTADAYDSELRGVRELQGGGFLSAFFAPGPANVIAGAGCGVRLGTAEPVVPDGGLVFVLTATSRGADRRRATPMPEQPFSPFAQTRHPPRYPGSLGGQVELITQVLERKAPTTDLYLPRLARQQIQSARAATIDALLERKRVAFFEAQTPAEVAAALHLIDRFHLRAVLVGPERIAPFLEEICRLGAGVVMGPAHVEDRERLLREFAEAARAGVPAVFGPAIRN